MPLAIGRAILIHDCVFGSKKGAQRMIAAGAPGKGVGAVKLASWAMGSGPVGGNRGRGTWQSCAPEAGL